MSKDYKNKPAAGTGSEVAKTGAGAVATFDYGADKGTGLNDMKGSDLAIPFLNILQSNSPQVEANNPDGAKAGLLLNSVTQTLIDGKKGKGFIPCHREDLYMEWTPRDNGGGLVGRHAPDSKEVKDAIASSDKKFGKLKTKAGNDLVETHYVYGLTLDDDGAVDGFAVVACSSTKIKPFKNWFTAMYMIKGQPPLFAHRVKIVTVSEKNKKGSYYNFQFNPLKGDTMSSLIDPATEGNLLMQAKDFRDMVVSGAAKAAFETQANDAAPNGVDEEVDPEGDGKAPF